ncbi:MAG TPA: hypothetical protein VN259_11140 [Xanthomonadales bacterium]|nr:hypothetical protein [Xanthomonadales bacterium]
MWDREPIQAAPQTEEIFQVPKDTTPTWEVELLLSGALVFSMLQVPGLLDEAIAALRPRLTGSLNYGGFMLYFYLKITSYALIATFVLHLSSRAIWVAALGLRSVYPGGVDWDKLSRGPIYLEYAQRTTQTLDQMIDRADNRASLVFAFGLLLVLMSLAIMAFTIALVAIGGLLGPLLLNDGDGTWLTMILVGAFVVPTLLATLIDRRWGARIPVTHWLAGAIRGVYRSSAMLVWGRFTNPIMLTFFSRMGITRSNVMMMGALYSLMAVVLVEFLLRAGVIALPGESFLPAKPAEREMRAINYAESRSQRDALEGQPYIPGEIVRGPYLRLFVPYLPRRIEPVIERDCPAAAIAVTGANEVERQNAAKLRTDAVLDCAASTLHPVTLNGAPITDLRYDIAEDPVSGLRGFVAMIDVRELPRGRHELVVAKPIRLDREEQPEPAIIPFWR